MFVPIDPKTGLSDPGDDGGVPSETANGITVQSFSHTDQLVPVAGIIELQLPAEVFGFNRF